jgi:uncharacterized protein (UPF0332 family)
MSTFDPHDFLEIARQLVSADNQTEAGYRTAISRAYYAALWIARSKVDNSPGYGQFYSDRSHDEIWDYLESDTNAVGKSLGKIGKELKRERVRADYRSRPVRAIDAANALEDAERLIADLEKL